ncbi:MAG: tetratricopeptide repeat protein [Candidatus Omnitrophica bacterium]|nr:tetratricopeptide repeat protein [Candidatus Omnitrophota bacterium]
MRTTTGSRTGPSEAPLRRKTENPGKACLPARQACLALLLAGAALYSFSFKIPFLWDDQHLILEDRFIRSWFFLPDLFGPSFYREIFYQSYYRPLQGLSFLIDHQLWGLNPFGYHLTSVLFHLANGTMLFFLARFLLGGILPSFFAGLLFLLHPVAVPAVGYLSGRADPMAVLGILASCLSWWNFRQPERPNRIGWYLFSLGSVAFAWFSKESGLVLPLLLLGLDGAHPSGGRRLRRGERWAPYLPMALMAIAYFKLRQGLGFAGPQPSLEGLGRWLTIPSMLLSYLRIYFLPLDLHMERRIPWLSAPDLLNFWGPLLALAALGWLLFRFRKERGVLFGAGWFFLAWLPISGLFVLLDPNMADHWLYLPGIGLCLAMGGILAQAVKAPNPRPILALAGAFALALAGISLHRQWVWSDPLRLYAESLRYPPESAMVHNNLGNLLLKQGRPKEALTHYERALALKPDYAEAHNNLAAAYERMGELKKAQTGFERALSLDPANTQAAFNQINLDLEQGRLDEARSLLERIQPRTHKDRVQQRLIEAQILIRQEKSLEAERQLRALLEAHPREAEALNLLGISLRRQGKGRLAIPVLKESIDLAPHQAAPWVNLGNAYRDLGEREEAIRCYRKALELDASHPQAASALKELLSR